MINDIEFRIAKPDDFLQITNIVNDKKSEATITERIKQKQILCAIKKDEIIGFLGWDKRYAENKTAWFIEQITVREDMRRRGVGTELLNCFLELCKRKRIHQVYATIQHHNNASLRLFQKIGGSVIENLEKNFVVVISLH